MMRAMNNMNATNASTKEIIEVGIRYTSTILTLLERGYDFGVKTPVAEKTAGFVEELEEKLRVYMKTGDLVKDRLYQSCCNIHGFTNIESQKGDSETEIFLKIFGLNIPNIWEWLYDQKESTNVTTAIVNFVDDYKDSSRMENVTFKGHLTAKEVYKQAKQLFEGCYSEDDVFDVYGLQYEEWTQYLYNGHIYTYKKVLERRY